jgi:hypothetical protein
MKADECRWNAAACRKEVNAARTEEVKRNWLHLANSWDQLAKDEEKARWQLWLLLSDDGRHGGAPTRH